MAHTIQKCHPTGFDPNRNAQSNRKNFQPYTKNHQKQHGDPESRCTGYHQTITFYYFINWFSTFHSCQCSKQKSYHSGKDPGNNHQKQRVCKFDCNHRCYFLTIKERYSHISPYKIFKPCKITLHWRLTYAPILFKLRNLLLTHTSEGSLPHIGL